MLSALFLACFVQLPIFSCKDEASVPFNVGNLIVNLVTFNLGNLFESILTECNFWLLFALASELQSF